MNWDVVAERHLSDLPKPLPFTYRIPDILPSRSQPRGWRLPLIKLHGSANWHYCDACQTTQVGAVDEKTAYTRSAFLECSDLDVLREVGNVRQALSEARTRRIQCRSCRHTQTTARVATFSYTKAFDFFPFHASWDAARRRLTAARQWIFIGYSLPEADFAFKHLLKSAQLTSRRSKEIHVITKEEPPSPENAKRRFTVAGRYEQLFDKSALTIWYKGFETWTAHVRV